MMYAWASDSSDTKSENFIRSMLGQQKGNGLMLCESFALSSKLVAKELALR